VALIAIVMLQKCCCDCAEKTVSSVCRDDKRQAEETAGEPETDLAKVGIKDTDNTSHRFTWNPLMPVKLPVPGRNTANVSGYMKF
jgi:hypothetical protein